MVVVSACSFSSTSASYGCATEICLILLVSVLLFSATLANPVQVKLSLCERRVKHVWKKKWWEKHFQRIRAHAMQIINISFEIGPEAVYIFIINTLQRIVFALLQKNGWKQYRKKITMIVGKKREFNSSTSYVVSFLFCEFKSTLKFTNWSEFATYQNECEH